MKEKHTHDPFDAVAYYDAILAHSKTSQEAAYSLLKHRLNAALRIVYDEYSFLLIDDFDDSIDDFFLYLFDGDGDDKTPFSVLRKLHNKRALFKWVMATYRFFLMKKGSAERRRKESACHVQEHHGEEFQPLTDETMIQYLATAIAYADQEFNPRNRFVFYRMILSLLDHQQGIPQEAVAHAIGMNHITYRVCTKRQKDRFLGFIHQLELGETLPLDRKHQLMKERLMEHFETIYDTLESYFQQSIEEMPKGAAFQNLRWDLCEAHGLLMHENRPSYGYDLLSIKQIYEIIKTSWSLREDSPPLPETGRGPAPILPPSTGLSAQ